MSICNAKRRESTLHSAYNGTRVITVTVRAYRSDADVTLILPAGKPNLGCWDSTTDDVRRNYKSSKWKQNKVIFLTSTSITRITLRFHLNDGRINLNDCRTSASTSHRKNWPPTSCSAKPGAGGDPSWWSWFTPERLWSSSTSPGTGVDMAGRAGEPAPEEPLRAPSQPSPGPELADGRPSLNWADKKSQIPFFQKPWIFFLIICFFPACLTSLPTFRI